MLYRLLIFVLFTVPLFSQGSFTRYYNIVSDDFGMTTVTEFPNLETSIMSNIKLDGTIHCLPEWVKETTTYDLNGTVFPSTIEPVVINNVTINSVAPGAGTVFAGTAIYDLVSKNLNFFNSDDVLSVEILKLFNEKPCQQLVVNRILIGQPIPLTVGTGYWYNIPQQVVTVQFGN